MSASDEIDEMHLTPNGWVQGSSKIDFAGWTHRDTPADRLLTASFREHISSSYSPMDLSPDMEKQASDADILAALQNHGIEPRPGTERYRGWPEFVRQIGYKKTGGAGHDTFPRYRPRRISEFGRTLARRGQA